MTQIFTSLLFTSAIGTALAAFLVLLRPITRRIFSAHWHYYIWLVILVVMMLPLRINLPDSTILKIVSEPYRTIVYSTTDGYIHENDIIKDLRKDASATETVIKSGSVFKNYLPQIAQIWSLISLILIFRRIIAYFLFMHRLKKHSEIISCPEISMFTKRKVNVRSTGYISSPLITGILKPVLLLPKGEITKKQLYIILFHETTHLKRNDILIKWLVGIVKCIHWYNPAIYLISRRIDIDCEISCDISVVKNMEKHEQSEYMETVLSLLKTGKSKSAPLTTGMAGKINILKKRFRYIKNGKRTGKAVNIISAAIAIAVLLSSVFVSGVLSYEILGSASDASAPCMEVTDNDMFIDLIEKKNIHAENSEKRIEVSENIYDTDDNSSSYVSLNKQMPDFISEVTEPATAEAEKQSSHSYEIEKSEKPFPEIPIYKDLSPTDKEETEHLQSESEYKDNKVVSADSNNAHTETKPARKIKSDDSQEAIEGSDIVLSYCALTLEDASIGEIEKILNDSGATISKDAKTDLSKNYLLGSCEKKDDIRTMCDENGNITLYFGKDANHYVDVTFKESETDKYIASYGIMPDNSKAYSFIGFEKNKEYNIEMQAQTNEKLSYLIY